MKIKIPHDNENFSVWTHPDRPWLLVKPTGVKQKWKKDELWWRSMVVSPDGTVLSAALPKFKNLGENAEDSADFEKALASTEDVLFTNKIDGSLAIRSVINGEVVWRTRGTFGTEDNQMLRDIQKLASQHGEVLTSPRYGVGESWHFEFCHPDHQVILPVHEPSLTLISGVCHETLQLKKHWDLRTLAGNIGCPVVELHELPLAVDDLIAVVNDFKGREGIVARFDKEQRYIKIKGAEYLAQHRLRFAFTPRNAIMMCREFNFATADDFVNHLYSLGLDWEIASERQRWFHLFNEARDFVHNAVADVQQFVTTYGDLYGTKQGSKEYARLVTEAYSDQLLRTTCFLLASGKADPSGAAELMMSKVVENMLKATPEVEGSVA